MEIYVDDSKLTLHGLQQHYVKLAENEKNRKLNELLDALEFNQVVVFVKSVQRAIQLDKLLQECNFPSVAIHASMKQGAQHPRPRVPPRMACISPVARTSLTTACSTPRGRGAYQDVSKL